jgi:DNA-binding CsgD family transcriptional regulator
MTEFDAALVPHARRPSPSPELDEVRFHAERLIGLVDRLRDNRSEEPTHSVLARLLRQARHHPPAVCASLAVFPLPVEQREFRQAHSVLVDGNPRARVLLPREFAVDDAVSGPNSLTGAEVRVHESPLSTMAVVDGRIALLAVDRTLVVLQDHQAVQAVRTLLDSVWDNALDANSVRWVDLAWPEGSTHRRVLRLLSAGHTDDVAARRLGMSVRTYRRHVAELMTGLDARSRFHAGVLATQLGLVRYPASASSSASIAAE